MKYIQKGLYAGYRTFMTSADVLDGLGDRMRSEDIEKIEGSMRGNDYLGEYTMGKKMKYPNTTVYEKYLNNYMNRAQQEGSYGRASGSDWLVSHVEWRSQKKVAFIKYINEYGDEQVDIVGEDFVVPEYAERSTEKDPYGLTKTYHTFDGKILE